MIALPSDEVDNSKSLQESQMPQDLTQEPTHVPTTHEDERAAENTTLAQYYAGIKPQHSIVSPQIHILGLGEHPISTRRSINTKTTSPDNHGRPYSPPPTPFLTPEAWLGFNAVRESERRRAIQAVVRRSRCLIGAGLRRGPKVHLFRTVSNPVERKELDDDLEEGEKTEESCDLDGEEGKDTWLGGGRGGAKLRGLEKSSMTVVG